MELRTEYLSLLVRTLPHAHGSVPWAWVNGSGQAAAAAVMQPASLQPPAVRLARPPARGRTLRDTPRLHHTTRPRDISANKCFNIKLLHYLWSAEDLKRLRGWWFFSREKIGTSLHIFFSFLALSQIYTTVFLTERTQGPSRGNYGQSIGQVFRHSCNRRI